MRYLLLLLSLVMLAEEPTEPLLPEPLSQEDQTTLLKALITLKNADSQLKDLNLAILREHPELPAKQKAVVDAIDKMREAVAAAVKAYAAEGCVPILAEDASIVWDCSQRGVK